MDKKIMVSFAPVLFVLAMLVSTPVFASGPALAPSPCDTVGTSTLSFTQEITEPDSATSGGNWATDTFTENINVWMATDGSGTFCANGNTTDGTFVTTGPVS